MSSSSPSYIIVGAGVFGVSTAYYIIKKYPNASVTIVDREAYDANSRVAASWDWNKVVRADYSDIVYVKMGCEAQDIFKSDPLWKPYFHETGIYWTCRSDYAQEVIDNYKKLGRTADLKSVSVEQGKQLHNGLFKHADHEEVKEVLINPTSGWAAAGDCLRAVTKYLLERGVKYEVAEVASLEFSGSECTGIKTTSGKTLKASRVILSTGAYTSKLLDQSARASGIDDLRAGDRIVAGGIVTAMKVLDEATYPRFEKMPVGMHGYRADQGPFLGSLPPTPDRELKWWGPTIFRNTIEASNGSRLSAPPAKADYAQWQMSRKLKEEIPRAAYAFYGDEVKDWKFENYRICWDAFTSNGDFIISPHPAAKGLYVATCGSFHGWKFFPIVGKYVLDMLEGSLPADLVAKWAWDSERGDARLNGEYPHFEMKDLLDHNVEMARL